VFISENNN